VSETENKIEISEVSCPDNCNMPEAQKGCHFKATEKEFTCTKCQLRIRRNYNGYVLQPSDFQEMLHGDKITAEEKRLKDRDGTESLARLMLDPSYRVCRAPKNKAVLREQVQEICPKCGAKLHLVTRGNGTKYYGCSGNCTFFKEYVPHTFSRQAQAPARIIPKPNNGKAAGPETKPAASITQPGEIDPIFSSLFPSEPTEAKGPVLDAAGKPEEPAEPEILNSDIFNIDPLLKLPDDFKEPLMPDMPADPAVPDEPPTFPGSAPTAEEKSNTAAAAESSDGAATDAKASGETATDSGGGNYKYAHIPRFVRDMLELPKDTLTAMAPKIAPENRAPAQKGPAGPKGDEVVLPPHPELPLADLAHSSSASQAPAGTSPSTGISLS
jgi:hypothetical protein